MFHYRKRAHALHTGENTRSEQEEKLQKLSKTLSVCFIGLIFSLSVFGNKIAAIFAPLKYLAPLAGLAAIIYLLIHLLRSDTLLRELGPEDLESEIQLRRVIVTTITAVALALMSTELLIVEPVERLHFVKYGLLSILLFLSFDIDTHRWRMPRAAICSAAVGILDESVQNFVPGRVFDTRDMLLNAVGALLGAVCLGIGMLWAAYFQGRDT